MRDWAFNLIGGVMLVLLLIGAVFGGAWLRSRNRPIAPPPTSATNAGETKNAAQLQYIVMCAKCHGPDGHGDGDAAATLHPAPRDFAARHWRFERTQASIERVVREGIPGTAMPAYQQSLRPAEIQALGQYVLQLSEQSTSSATSTKSPAWQQSLEEVGFQSLRQPRIAPSLEVVDAQGKAWRLADQPGQAVLLYFWGTSCEPCLQSMPHLQQLAEQLQPAGLQLVLICADEDDVEVAQEVAASASPTTKTYVDETGRATTMFEVQALPKVWLIDSQGRQVASASGKLDWESASLRNALTAFCQHSKAAAQP